MKKYVATHLWQPLGAYRATLNPLQLRDAIYHNLAHLFTYPNATPGTPQNVFQTLAYPDQFPAARAALAGGDTVDKPKDGLPTVPPPATAASISRKEEATSQ